ncbi:MAG TPA: hypothetical protein VJR92_01660 [Gemmatimonadaceae bacterium]|nr:hypothetical protein [Gemmatimonadaceae bacterium]
MITPLPRALATQLLLIRTALLAGLLLFGAATWYIRRGTTIVPMPADRAQQFGYIFIALAVSALGGMFFVRSRLEKGVEGTAAVQQYMTGYAMAEGTALFGGVTWYMGGNQNWYIAGVLLMVTAFQILPIKRES